MARVDEEHRPGAQAQLDRGILESLLHESVGNRLDGHSRCWIDDAEFRRETEFVDRLPGNPRAVARADLDDPDGLAIGNEGGVDLGIRRMELTVEQAVALGGGVDGPLRAEGGEERLEIAAPALEEHQLVGLAQIDAGRREQRVRNVGLRVERKRVGGNDIPQRTAQARECRELGVEEVETPRDDLLTGAVRERLGFSAPGHGAVTGPAGARLSLRGPVSTRYTA